MGRTRMAESGILIKGGEVVNEDGRQMADVYVEGRTIKAVGPNLEAGEGVRVIDATGKLVIPGGIDTHTHCQMPFMGMVAVDDFFIGTKAPHCLQPLDRLGRREGVLRLQPSHGGHPLGASTRSKCSWHTRMSLCCRMERSLSVSKEQEKLEQLLRFMLRTET